MAEITHLGNFDLKSDICGRDFSIELFNGQRRDGRVQVEQSEEGTTVAVYDNQLVQSGVGENSIYSHRIVTEAYVSPATAIDNVFDPRIVSAIIKRATEVQ
jgi:hypothetical protein